MADLSHLQYPIGKFSLPEETTFELITSWVDDLSAFPELLVSLTEKLDQTQLAATYRPDGWTVRQVVHHLADSHVNAYMRFKLALTEEKPIVRPYFEDKWAELPDGKSGDIGLSLELLSAIHNRLVSLLRTLDAKDFNRQYIHPATQQTLTLAYLTGNYAWHGKHHLAHINIALKNVT